VARKVSDTLHRKSDTPERALGTVITELRLKRGWAYKQVAHSVGCSATYMNDMEHGERNPTFRVLQAIAHLHGLKLSQLLALGERKYERRWRKK
jgi:transcriptional regulator with XRE-family HTH domain